MRFSSIAILLGLLFVSPASPARVVLSVTIGKTLTLPCSDEDPGRNVEWHFQQKDHSNSSLCVAKLHNGTLYPENDFKGRVKSFHLEKEGNYSLALIPVYNDQGIYKCQYGDHILSDVKLDILVTSPTSIAEGMSASLPCFGNINKQAHAVDLDIHWKKDGLTVYQLYKNNITYGPGFKNRVSLSTEHALQGNMSLTIRPTRFSDQGDYQCFYNNSPTLKGNPDSPNLIVEEHPAQNLTVKAGGLLSIPLHTTDPVRVTFRAGLGLEEVLLIPGNTGPARYGKRCDQRCEVQDYTLLVRSVTLEDAGVYKVTDPETNKTISRVHLQVSGLPRSPTDTAGLSPGAVIGITLSLLALVAGVIYLLWRNRTMFDRLPAPVPETQPQPPVRMSEIPPPAPEPHLYEPEMQALMAETHPSAPQPHLSEPETQDMVPKSQNDSDSESVSDDGKDVADRE